MRRTIGLGLGLVLLLALSTSEVAADGRFSPDAPLEGIGFVLWSGGTTDDMVMAAPHAASFWGVVDGRFVGYTAGAPPIVNATFKHQFPNGVPEMTPVVVSIDPARVPGYVDSRGCTTPPLAIQRVLLVLPMPPGLCLRYTGDVQRPPAPYTPTLFEIVQGGAPTFGHPDFNLSALLHSYCHAWQQRMALDAGLGLSASPGSGTWQDEWLSVPAFADFVERTGWVNGAEGWRLPPESRNVRWDSAGTLWNHLEDSAEVCVAHFGFHGRDLLQHIAPIRDEWAQRWLAPLPPLPPLMRYSHHYVEDGTFWVTFLLEWIDLQKILGSDGPGVPASMGWYRDGVADPSWRESGLSAAGHGDRISFGLQPPLAPGTYTATFTLHDGTVLSAEFVYAGPE